MRGPQSVKPSLFPHDKLTVSKNESIVSTDGPPYIKFTVQYGYGFVTNCYDVLNDV